MLFSSNIFIFVFLPAVLLLYYILPNKLRNTTLLFFSLVFYAFDSISHAVILVAICLANYILAQYLATCGNRRLALSMGIVGNLGVLIYYKYVNFFLSAYADILSVFSVPVKSVSVNIVLPIGVSFFTFHAISYLVDIYKNKVPPSRDLVGFSMYFVMFPHLIAGPIVRYSEVSSSIYSRICTLQKFHSGCVRFCLGLGKKILLADQLAVVSEKIFSLNSVSELNTPVAWLGILCYTFQIYYDFSGYTDMGIGLAEMFGFTFPENFMQPYRSANISTFWRTWHMTLGRWFKDYLYIPLGGNKKTLLRTCLNLLIVFFLCGLWHGASYPFMIWGLYYGILLCVERILKTKFNITIHGILGIVFSFFLVVVGWVFFSQPTLSMARDYLYVLFSFNFTDYYYSVRHFLTFDKDIVLLASIFFAFFNFPRVDVEQESGAGWIAAKSGFALVILVLACANMALYGFKPFIYFQF
uniref:Putative membrane protein involved in D-alanine export n=1 Tax=Desulfovibrio sp. U5L TaxID=596152 RepID=I2Q355_9BACT